jgi:hypothetical protein
MVKSKASSPNTFLAKVKEAFAFGLGSAGGVAALVAVGLVFLVPAIFLFARESERPEEQQRTWIKALAILLAIVGVGFGLGNGGGQLFAMVKNVAT